MEKVEQTNEYARVCSAWVAIKSYYLLFYLETIIMALVEADPSRLKSSHNTVRKFMRTQFDVNAIASSFIGYAEIGKNKDYINTRMPSGSNLRAKLSDEDRRKQLMKKLAIYAKDEYKRAKGINQLRGSNKTIFMNQKIGLMDFFYWYRIKSNYRDLEFIAGEKATTIDLFYFYTRYNEASLSVARAYVALINDLYKKRTGDDVKLIEL